MSRKDPDRGLHGDPLQTIADASEQGGDAVLAVITGVDGPSYRPLGAYMAILPGGARVGTLSSGCIEQDIVLHAAEALDSGRPKTVRYGLGSPFIDIKLPCGGGLEILLLPRPEQRVLSELVMRQAARRPVTLAIAPDHGGLEIRETGATGRDGDRFLVRIMPELYFYVFGKGPEASTFAALVQSAGYPNMVLSPDQETLERAHQAGSPTCRLKAPEMPVELLADRWSAVVLFFHDHEWEPPILAGALRSDAFYIGAQGSRRARDARMLALQEAGIGVADLARLRGPIGLVPSVRDARTLAVSVLAEILSEHQKQVR